MIEDEGREASRAFGQGTAVYSGDFFERVAERLFGGERSSRPLDPDLSVWGIETGIEVKSAGSRPFRLSTDQLEAIVDAGRGFPYEHVAYALFYYTNGRVRDPQMKQRTVLGLHSRHSDDFYRFLVENTQSLYLIDAAILEARRRIGPISTKSLPGLGEATIDISVSCLRQLTNGMHGVVLSGWELNPVLYPSRSVTASVTIPTVLFTELLMKFPIHIVGSPSLADMLIQHMTSRGVQLHT